MCKCSEHTCRSYGALFLFLISLSTWRASGAVLDVKREGCLAFFQWPRGMPDGFSF